MKLSIPITSPPLTKDEIAQGIEASAALARMRKVWTALEVGRGVVVGKKGPAFTK